MELPLEAFSPQAGTKKWDRNATFFLRPSNGKAPPFLLGEAPEDSLTLAEALSRFEKVYLLNALKKNNWKRGPTADSLGMDRRTLFRKMKDFGLEKE